MTYVITSACIDVKDQSCVEVCPVDCIHFDENLDAMLYINPDECIDCGACVPECPVEAIYDETQLPEDQSDWLQINAEKAKGLPVVNEKGDALPGAEERKKQLGF